jgi:hypothetical protein
MTALNAYVTGNAHEFSPMHRSVNKRLRIVCVDFSILTRIAACDGTPADVTNASANAAGETRPAHEGQHDPALGGFQLLFQRQRQPVKRGETR